MTAAVEEARDAETYVSAHLYTSDAIRRAVECGVHSLEHCNNIDMAAAELAARAGAVAVPTLVTYEALLRTGRPMGCHRNRSPRSKTSGAGAWKA